MQIDFHFLSPVQVVRVTKENIQEVAEWCGGEVKTTESTRVPGRIDSYVLVPTPKNAKTSWAFPGLFVTKRLVIDAEGTMRYTFSVFRRDYFEKNYFSNPTLAMDETWEKKARQDAEVAQKGYASLPVQVTTKRERPKHIPGRPISEIAKITPLKDNRPDELVEKTPVDLHADVPVPQTTLEGNSEDGFWYVHPHSIRVACSEVHCVTPAADGEHRYEDGGSIFGNLWQPAKTTEGEPVVVLDRDKHDPI